MLDCHCNVLPDAQGPRRSIVAAHIALVTGETHIRDFRAVLSRGNAGSMEILHIEIPRARVTWGSIGSGVLARPRPGLVAIGAPL